jgi:glycosyltransferase involved in cell wall biosynthesis
MMNVWLVNIGEPLPVDPGGARLLRIGTLAERLAADGHQVLWWTTRFDHSRKRQRTGAAELLTSSGVRLRLLDAVAYRRNVSLARLINHRQLAKTFAKQARSELRPDIIICSYPTIELSCEVVRYGQEYNVPTVLDLRDLWPDLFLDILPRWARSVGRLLLAPLFAQKARAMTGASAIFATNDSFLQWGLQAARRPRNAHDDVFPHSYRRVEESDVESATARDYWADLGIGADTFNVCFFGNIVPRVLDLDTVLDAARLIARDEHDIRFVLCGVGEDLERLKARAVGLPVVFPGWVGASLIKGLMKLSKVGLVPYESRWNFVGSLPNKVNEYLSEALPIVSCLEGELRRLIEGEVCGLHYKYADASGLASALSSLRGDATLRQRLSANAADVFNKRFDADIVFGRYVDRLSALSSAFQERKKGAA